MPSILHDLKNNLAAGIRLAIFRHCELSDFSFSFDQLVLLLGLDLLLEIGSDFLNNLPQPEFYGYALPTYAFNLLCLFSALYVTGKLLRDNYAPLRMGIIIYSFGPLSVLLQLVITQLNQEPAANDAEPYPWLYPAFSIYVMMLLCRTLYLVSAHSLRITSAGFVLMMLAVSIPQQYFAENDEFWYSAAAENDKDNEREDPYAAYRDLDAEQLMYRQPTLLASALENLTPQRKKISDLFFVGFASYAHEDVFFNEITYAKQLLDERFGTRGHSINLVNHLRSKDLIPLATATNLRATLKRIGKLMNPEEDVLLLYLTSHGSKTRELSVAFWPLALNDITPESLRSMLDEAGIKWRVIIISACYSGGFINALKGPGTVVATAAAADRTSFGCGNEFDFTYFGEALFKEQLQRHYSFLTALHEVKTSIVKRETREKITPSLPQLSVGAMIEPKLQRLSDELRSRQCVTAKTLLSNCGN